MKTRAKRVVAVAWYSPDQWQRLLEVSADADLLEKTHEEWLVAAQQAFDEIVASGVVPIKVPIEIQDLIDWCHDRNMFIDAQARADYVIKVLKRGSPNLEAGT